MPSVLVTGARQGLGLEFCRQFAAAKWQVHATCLDPATAEDLKALDAEHDNVAVHELDVDDHDQVGHLAEGLSGEAIDLLLNNAGRAGSFRCGRRISGKSTGLAGAKERQCVNARPPRACPGSGAEAEIVRTIFLA